MYVEVMVCSPTDIVTPYHRRRQYCHTTGARRWGGEGYSRSPRQYPSPPRHVGKKGCVRLDGCVGPYIVRSATDDQSHLFAIFVFLVATFPATWLLMLFFGNVGHPLGYWGVLPLGIIASMLLSGSSFRGLMGTR